MTPAVGQFLTLAMGSFLATQFFDFAPTGAWTLIIRKLRRAIEAAEDVKN